MNLITIKQLDEQGTTSIVKNMDNNKIYVRKIISAKQKEVYEKLRYLNIRFMPKIYEIEDGDNDSVQVLEEYIEGKNLDEVIGDGKKFTEDDTKNFLIQISVILSQLHSHKIVHRDIKPSNIIVDDKGRYYLNDCGVAIEGGKADERTDVYDLGKLANYLLTGETSEQNIYQGQLTGVISKCLEPNPDKRYANAGKLRRALEGSKIPPKVWAINALKLGIIIFTIIMIIYNNLK